MKDRLIDQSILQLKLQQLTYESRQFLDDDDQVISYLELEGDQTIAITQKRKLLVINSNKVELTNTLNLNAKEFRLNGQGEIMHLIDRNQIISLKMTQE